MKLFKNRVHCVIKDILFSLYLHDTFVGNLSYTNIMIFVNVVELHYPRSE